MYTPVVLFVCFSFPKNFAVPLNIAWDPSFEFIFNVHLYEEEYFKIHIELGLDRQVMIASLHIVLQVHTYENIF